MAKSYDSCLSCVIKEMSDREYDKLLYDYQEQLDEEIKTPEDIYRERLLSCKACEYFRNGLCRLCGCFVVLRAGKQPNRCADSPARW